MERDRRLRNGLAGMLLVLLAFFCVIERGHLSVPAHTKSMQKTTESSDIRDIVRTYDRDIYDILEKEEEDWEVSEYFDGTDSFYDRIDTAVHEIYHDLVADSLAVYVDGDTSYALDYFNESCFRTEEMASSIPEEKRTDRYDTYVGKNSTLTSNRDGAYGLLNEFAAYYWGFRATSSLVKYCAGTGWDTSVSKNYALNAGNDINAYAEFKYWILSYLIYAEKNEPAAYDALLCDDGFCSAYAAIETRFAALIAENKNSLSDVNEMLKSRGDKIVWTDGRISAGGYYADLSDYETLKKAMEEAEYEAMDRMIKSHADGI